MYKTQRSTVPIWCQHPVQIEQCLGGSQDGALLFFETKRYGSVSAKMRRFIRNGINDNTILLNRDVVLYCRCFCFTGRYLHKESQHHTVKKESRHGMVRVGF